MTKTFHMTSTTIQVGNKAEMCRPRRTRAENMEPYYGLKCDGEGNFLGETGTMGRSIGPVHTRSRSSSSGVIHGW